MVKAIKEWVEDLRQVGGQDWPDYLRSNSGLPGPRANISLAIAVKDVVEDPGLIDQLAQSSDEYQAMCGAVCVGAQIASALVDERLRALAVDGRWRVREGVVIGMQEAADQDLTKVQALMRTWSSDPDPLIARAAVATVCEPRLLHTTEAAARAIDICRRATVVLATIPIGSARRSPSARALRQSLGYCWSVAVAADPKPGLKEFDAIDTTDADLDWIVRTNRAKERLARFL